MSVSHWISDQLSYLVCRFRTWQLRHFTDRFPIGTLIWCDLVLLATAPSRLVPGEIAGKSSHLNGQRVVDVHVFREGPLGTKVDTITIAVSRISWRNK